MSVFGMFFARSGPGPIRMLPDTSRPRSPMTTFIHVLLQFITFDIIGYPRQRPAARRRLDRRGDCREARLQQRERGGVLHATLARTRGSAEVRPQWALHRDAVRRVQSRVEQLHSAVAKLDGSRLQRRL